jgi:predicted SAM-dependent methyltransferase
MLSVKQRLGSWLIPKLPMTRHVFNHIRLEINGLRVRTLHRVHPGIRRKVATLNSQRDLLVNVACGPFGVDGWINLDLFQHPGITVVADCRRRLPLPTSSCLGIHVEMFLEHLDPLEECPLFLQECLRCLQPNGILRVIVPDAKLFLSAYLSDGWEAMNEISYGGERWDITFPTKMDALNHVFIQEWEHYGGWDAAKIEFELLAAGFKRVTRCTWKQGKFPGGPIDRDFHQANALHFEAEP